MAGSFKLHMVGARCDSLQVNGVDLADVVSGVQIVAHPGGARVTLDLKPGVDLDIELDNATVEAITAPQDEA